MSVDPRCIFCGIVAGEIPSTTIAARAKDRLGADGVNLLNCCGAEAWQSVFHLHVHVIPRTPGAPETSNLNAAAGDISPMR